MRCLYCGGELALLKKLRGGGTFCSEAHRQKYQEEYSQLALSRLMQANPKAEKRAPAPPAEHPRPAAPPLQPAAVPEAQRATVAAPEPCGFLLPRIEPRDDATPLFSHAPMPLDQASTGAHEHARTAVNALPRAEVFQAIELRFALKDAGPAAPGLAPFEIWPEFKETTAAWLTPISDAPRAEANLDAADTSVCTTAVETDPPRTAPRRAVEVLPVTLQLAPPPNSGPQDTCRPTPFPAAAPELPRVEMNPLRLRFGFGAAPESKRAPAPREAAAPFEPMLMLGAPVERRNRLPLVLSVAGGLILVAGGGVFLFTRGNAAAPAAHHNTHTAPAPIAETDWSTDWSGKAPRGEHLSILRPSLSLSDYRIEFQGQIESKSLGWIFRASDPKNYYALKLEIAKPGAMAEIALVRTVLEGGQQKDRARIPLRTKFARDTVFKIRTDVEGATFRTWIQGELVDTWTDNRFKTGGFGLLTDAAGRAKLQMIQLSELQGRARTR